MDKREFPEEWFAQTAPVWDVSDLRANRPVLLVYVDHHPEALNYPLYRTLEYLERVGISARVFGPVQGSLEGYRLTRSEFEERERGEAPLFFLSHGPRFEYRGRTFSVQDAGWSLLRHDVDFITWSHQDLAGKEYLPNEMIKRLQEALMRVASNVLDKPVRPLLDPFWFERRIRIPLFPKYQPAVHIFVGTPAEGDTLPFWVRFLMRVRQRGWAPVLVGPRGDDLRMLLQNVLEEADPMQDLPFIQGEAPVYYAIVPVVGDQYALETAAREGFHTSGAKTLQWIRAYGGFFTGTQWARTLTSDNGLFHNNPGGLRIYDQEGQPNKNGDAPSLVHESKEPEVVPEECAAPWGYLGEQFKAIISGEEPPVREAEEKQIQSLLATLDYEPMAQENGDLGAMYLRSVLHAFMCRGLSGPRFLRAVLRSISLRQRLAESDPRTWWWNHADALVASCIPGAKAGLWSTRYLRESVERDLMRLQPKRGEAAAEAHAEYLKEKMKETPIAEEFLDAVDRAKEQEKQAEETQDSDLATVSDGDMDAALLAAVEKSAVSTIPLLPVGVTFPESAEAYSPRNVENLTRLFRGLGIELVPVGGRGGYDWGTQASILARHYFAKVPVLVVASGEERALPEESPLLWCATYYQFKDLYSVRLNTLTVFLASVRDHLRQTSVHYETRSRFCMEPIEALSGLHRDA